MGSLQQDSREETPEKEEGSDMAVVFPNIDTAQFMWKTSATETKIDNELEKFLRKPTMNRMATPETGKIRVEWPTILSSDCSTWLSTRKAESDKKHTENENTEVNPWLVKGGQKSAIDLASSVREGLLRAGKMNDMYSSDDEWGIVAESRLPLPISEDIPKALKTEEFEEVDSQTLSISAQVKMGLLRAGSVSLPPAPEIHQPKKESKPWKPKSLAEEVKLGLLRAGGQLKNEINLDEDEVSLTIEETIEPEFEPATVPLESLAETLRKSFMNITIEQPATPMKASFAENLRESLLNQPTSTAEDSKSESLDNWIMDDNQSEGASIITLDTITDSVDMEDFDDFKDMEHELSMWISKD